METILTNDFNDEKLGVAISAEKVEKTENEEEVAVEECLEVVNDEEVEECNESIYNLGTEEQKAKNRQLIEKYYKEIEKSSLTYYYGPYVKDILRRRVAHEDFVQEVVKGLLMWNSLARFDTYTDKKNYRVHLRMFLKTHIRFVVNHIYNTFNDIRHGCIELLNFEDDYRKTEKAKKTKTKTSVNEQEEALDTEDGVKVEICEEKIVDENEEARYNRFLIIDSCLSQLNKSYTKYLFRNGKGKKKELTDKDIFSLIYNDYTYEEMTEYITYKSDETKNIEKKEIIKLVGEVKNKLREMRNMFDKFV